MCQTLKGLCLYTGSLHKFTLMYILRISCIWSQSLFTVIIIQNCFIIYGSYVCKLKLNDIGQIGKFLCVLVVGLGLEEFVDLGSRIVKGFEAPMLTTPNTSNWISRTSRHSFFPYVELQSSPPTIIVIVIVKIIFISPN